MKKTLLFCIIFSLWSASNVLQAQQWHYYNPTAWFDVNAVEIPGPGVISIGGGQEANDSTQVMFQTNDCGLTWTENAHDGLAPWNKSIAFSDSLNGYGVGYDGRIIRTDDAGLNWGYAVYPINRDFNKIVYAGNGTYFVAGGNKTNDSIQTILRSNDYGNSWDVIYDTLGSWLKSIYFFDTLKGFAVGDKGVILSTANGGNMWTSIAAPVQRDFNAITFINADTGYIVGGTPSGLCRRTILRTVNGGINWSVLIDTAGGILKDISFADGLVGYSVGDSATIIKTVDGGLNWSPINIDSNLTGHETFNAVKFHDKNFGAIGGRNGVLYIYLDLQVEPFTLGISQIGNNDATLLGGINTHTKNARYSFVYSTNINFTSFDATQEINVQNDSLLLISAYIHGLTPNTVYYYYLKAITATDTIYGDTLNLYTGVNPPFTFQTLDATGVGGWQTTLNGVIYKFPEPVNLYFEYGHTPSFGSLVAASPASVNDTMMHNIQAYITGLQANSRYFFRLKGVSGTGTYYGDTKIFSAIDLPYVGTGSATNVTLNSAQLTGNVTNNGIPAALKFDYGLTAYYGNEVDAVPDSATGMGSVYATYSLSGLTPGTTYHFRLKAINSNGTSYGNDITFITGAPTASTFPASNISAHSAQLNAMVNANNNRTSIKFEYGLTNNYGTEVSAIPDSAFGNINTSVFFFLYGLISDTTYHYRIKAITPTAVVYGNDISFFTSSIPILSTQPPVSVTYHSAQINAQICANNYPTAIKFEWGLTQSYGNEVTAHPDSIYGIQYTNVSYELNSLLPHTTYHYRVKGICQLGTVFGNDMSFQTSYIDPLVLTQMASEISPHSAKLNAIVNPNNMATTIKFDYGTTPSYSNETDAIPAFSSDSANLNVYGNLTGLLSNTTYHFRIKAITSVDTVYGNDLIFFTGNPEIPNFDFETWTPVTFAKPQGWDAVMGRISRYSPACNGNYAIKIENDTIIGGQPGAISMGGSSDGQNFAGGIPFNARPDTLIGCFNYSIPANDTALVGILLKKQGVFISFNWFKIYGNSSGNYTELKFPIPYTTPGNADSLIIGFTSTDTRHLSQLIAGGYLIVDHIRFTGTTENIPNNDFENWDFNTIYTPDSWWYNNKYTPDPAHPQNPTVSRTEDAQHGNYAALVRNYLYQDYFLPYATEGYLSTGQDWAAPGFSVNSGHQTLTGYYKFLPENDDTMSINVTMYKNHVNIGGGNFQTNITVADYTPFIINLQCLDNIVPDSGAISIWSCSRKPLGNSLVYIDNLNFDGFLSVIKETPLPATCYIDFNVYPNPFNDQATVSFTTDHEDKVMVRLFDLSGKQVALLANGLYMPGEYKINLSSAGLNKGFYICLINTEKQVLSRKIIIY